MQETLHSGIDLGGLGHAGAGTGSLRAPPNQQPDADKWNSNAPERVRHETIEDLSRSQAVVVATIGTKW